MNNDSIVFVDTETTGLEPDRHEVWEVALILPNGEEVEYHIQPNLTTAFPGSLSLIKFYARTVSYDWDWHRDKSYMASDIAKLTEGRHLVGSVPSFDAVFLAKFLRSQGYCEAWHYQHIDVEVLVAGYLQRGDSTFRAGHSLTASPWDSERLSRAIGIDPDRFERHTALGDARWAKALYEKVMEV